MLRELLLVFALNYNGGLNYTYQKHKKELVNLQLKNIFIYVIKLYLFQKNYNKFQITLLRF